MLKQLTILSSLLWILAIWYDIQDLYNLRSVQFFLWQFRCFLSNYIHIHCWFCWEEDLSEGNIKRENDLSHPEKGRKRERQKFPLLWKYPSVFTAHPQISQDLSLGQLPTMKEDQPWFDIYEWELSGTQTRYHWLKLNPVSKVHFFGDELNSTSNHMQITNYYKCPWQPIVMKFAIIVEQNCKK